MEKNTENLADVNRLNSTSGSIFNESMKEELEYIKRILPSHYTCEQRDNGVHCYSEKGINDDKQWNYILLSFKKKFNDRLMEVYHQTCTNHVKFTVFLKNK